uniref:Uncharacterized protein n=1 Tax=Acanthochromis polyacanthus TaxID=80966 RepID=A0A3Q1H318_9TELE
MSKEVQDEGREMQKNSTRIQKNRLLMVCYKKQKVLFRFLDLPERKAKENQIIIEEKSFVPCEDLRGRGGTRRIQTDVTDEEMDLRYESLVLRSENDSHTNLKCNHHASNPAGRQQQQEMNADRSVLVAPRLWRCGRHDKDDDDDNEARMLISRCLSALPFRMTPTSMVIV